MILKIEPLSCSAFLMVKVASFSTKPRPLLYLTGGGGIPKAISTFSKPFMSCLMTPKIVFSWSCSLSILPLLISESSSASSALGVPVVWELLLGPGSRLKGVVVVYIAFVGFDHCMLTAMFR